MAKIVYESPADQAGFVQLPNVVLMDATLSLQAKVLYALFVYHSRGKAAAFPGQVKLGEEMGLTSRQVRGYVRELEKSMLVLTRRRGTRTNEYVLMALGKREMRKQQAEANFRNGEANGNPASALCGSELPPEVDAVKQMQALCESAGVRVEQVRFKGKPVNAQAFVMAAAVLDEFNRQAEAKLRVFTSAGVPSEAVKRVYGRVRLYPDIGIEKHADIIRRTLASRWWGAGEPNIGVVYGPNVFEDNIARSPEAKTTKQQRKEDLNQRLLAMMRGEDEE